MNYVNLAWKYARDVVSGRVIACEPIIQQCARSLLWRKEKRYKFDKKKAEKACQFICLFPHTKGVWAKRSEPFVLEGWQAFFVCMIYGWMRPDLTRVIRRARLYVARKNGKSDVAARIGLKMAAADEEYAPEVYCGATTEAQAWEVFRPAKRMVDKSEDFREFYSVEALAKSIICHEDDGFFKPLIGKPGDGSSPHCSIADEYHEHPDDTLVSTMETGMGARSQPLSLVTSTAGETIGGACYNDWLDCLSVLKGITEDDELFALVYTADPDDDWKSEAGLKKANPNFGVSVGRDFLLSQQKQAIASARKQGPFKTKHLNLWVGAMNSYFNVEGWKSCAVQNFNMDDYAGCPAWFGLDLASKRDIAALRVFIEIGNGKYAVFGKQYLPEGDSDTDFGANSERYNALTIDGWLERTDGNVIDFACIEQDILEITKIFETRLVGYDPYQGNYLATRLLAEGVPMVEYGQTVKNFSDPMKTLDALIASKRIVQDGDPCMDWMMGNVVAKEDKKENVFPNKARAENKIDGPVALMMAVGLSGVAIEAGEMDSYLETEEMMVF